uniref:Uncharacterized protein n=1 Tax=Arundo donax TaxID=35708 RepID=A0A0A9CLN6_ARUDO
MILAWSAFILVFKHLSFALANNLYFTQLSEQVELGILVSYYYCL